MIVWLNQYYFICRINTTKVMKKRLQLTLFVDEKDATALENIRKTHNPAQFALIKAHVTLCREDELEPLDRVLDNLKNLQHGPVSVQFGPPIRFSEDKGVLLPASGDNEAFQALRAGVLEGLTESPRRHEAHLTLMHPRNSACTDAVFEQISALDLPRELRFRTVSLIEQEGDNVWKVLLTVDLDGNGG